MGPLAMAGINGETYSRVSERVKSIFELFK